MHGIGAWVVHGVGFGGCINDVVYYLDGGVVGLVRLTTFNRQTDGQTGGGSGREGTVL